MRIIKSTFAVAAVALTIGAAGAIAPAAADGSRFDNADGRYNNATYGYAYEGGTFHGAQSARHSDETASRFLFPYRGNDRTQIDPAGYSDSQRGGAHGIEHATISVRNGAGR